MVEQADRDQVGVDPRTGAAGRAGDRRGRVHEPVPIHQGERAAWSEVEQIWIGLPGAGGGPTAVGFRHRCRDRRQVVQRLAGGDEAAVSHVLLADRLDRRRRVRGRLVDARTGDHHFGRHRPAWSFAAAEEVWAVRRGSALTSAANQRPGRRSSSRRKADAEWKPSFILILQSLAPGAPPTPLKTWPARKASAPSLTLVVAHRFFFSFFKLSPDRQTWPMHSDG